jgi:ribosome-binding protein aMBF1 (putative translation factor)
VPDPRIIVLLNGLDLDDPARVQSALRDDHVDESAARDVRAIADQVLAEAERLVLADSRLADGQQPDNWRLKVVADVKLWRRIRVDGHAPELVHPVGVGELVDALRRNLAFHRWHIQHSGSDPWLDFREFALEALAGRLAATDPEPWERVALGYANAASREESAQVFPATSENRMRLAGELRQRGHSASPGLLATFRAVTTVTDETEIRRLIAANIRRGRHSAGLSQEALAERLGIRVQEVSRWENAHRTPSWSALGELASALEQPLSAFLVVHDEDAGE